jgi:hypothetical protein
VSCDAFQPHHGSRTQSRRVPRRRLLADQEKSGACGTGSFADTSVFSMPAPGTWGDEPHTGVRGPGRDNWNISLFKNFLFNDTSLLQFRAEFFNIWNHPQWVGDMPSVAREITIRQAHAHARDLKTYRPNATCPFTRSS